MLRAANLSHGALRVNIRVFQRASAGRLDALIHERPRSPGSQSLRAGPCPLTPMPAGRGRREISENRVENGSWHGRCSRASLLAGCAGSGARPLVSPWAAETRAANYRDLLPGPLLESLPCRASSFWLRFSFLHLHFACPALLSLEDSFGRGELSRETALSRGVSPSRGCATSLLCAVLEDRMPSRRRRPRRGRASRSLAVPLALGRRSRRGRGPGGAFRPARGRAVARGWALRWRRSRRRPRGCG